ncbi:hypothetical protein [Flavobacterium franklandianum]|uniref:Lipoprotein n=1 Tax=Flavobacterium franklandianum TaxID=2594430 RepID=A0A553CMG3_9FLAO|nr:hypothetical protein [Flavobacterium franklandianum]TRX21641.1 hypothetical protein FNW17_07100 [Flavobacterium franklandianum]
MRNLLLLILTVFTLTSCDKDDDKPKTELEKLPPATQTGAKTFGCLLDGVAFVPGNQNLAKNCVYQYVNGYYFSLQGSTYPKNQLIGLGLSTDNLKIEEGKIYILQDKIDGNASGLYYFGDDITGIYELKRTSNVEKGEMKISKLDFTKHIVSGTFWYDIKDGKGVIHKIREGRFDMQYTN